MSTFTLQTVVKTVNKGNSLQFFFVKSVLQSKKKKKKKNEKKTLKMTIFRAFYFFFSSFPLTLNLKSTNKKILALVQAFVQMHQVPKSHERPHYIYK